MERICRLFDRSKQAYYEHSDFVQRKLAEEAFVLKFIKDIRKKDPGLGGEKLWKVYQRTFGPNFEYMVGRDKMEAIVSKYGLTVRKPRRKPRTTDSGHGLPVFRNLIKDLIPLKAQRIWVSDITYIPIWISTKENSYRFCYLSLITDAYSKEIVGWCVGETLGTEYAMKALDMALSRIEGQSCRDLIHHSDRGVQYASCAYVEKLLSRDIQISMTESGDPKDNAVAERINGVIKNELLKDIAFFSIEEVRTTVEKVIDFYNNERPHMSLDWLTPSEAAKMEGPIEKKWHSYRETYLKNLHIQEGASIFAG